MTALCLQSVLLPGVEVGTQAILGVNTVGFPHQRFAPHSITQVSGRAGGRAGERAGGWVGAYAALQGLQSGLAGESSSHPVWCESVLKRANT